MKMRKLIFCSLFVGVIQTPVNAEIIVDGDLSDWGVTHNGTADDWTPNAGIFHTIEDQNSYYLEPGYGGQNYDAEALYAKKGVDNFYIGLATGHNPETPQGSGSYGAGDFAIDFGRDGSFEVGINIKPSWDSFGIVAGVYKVTEWAYGLWADDTVLDYVNAEHPTSIISGDYLGLAELSISGLHTGYGQWDPRHEHYFYESSVSLDILRLAGWQGESFDIHWTQNCGNDSILVDPPAAVPTPGTVMLILTGLLGGVFNKKSLFA